MIQFNLLPDVKLEYIRARRAQRLVLLCATVAVGVSLAILFIMLSVYFAEKAHLHGLNDDITKKGNDLRKKPQIDRILTVQNQLVALGSLHDQKPAATRVFDYLNQVTPTEIGLTAFTIDFVEHTVTISGTAPSLTAINKYIDTLKFTQYKESGAKKDSLTSAFSDVVLGSFSLGSAKPEDPEKTKTTFTLNLLYDTKIFDETKNIQLNVPAQTTTRSVVDSPTDLFPDQPASTTSGGGR